ncbi:peptide/nickel transport system permease protein [Micromonospora rhizosphaerae]|uniref:Peptide/nickel transport system permease protein n=1 Tax=Micromonospora rhizosphaerae TaxID=568872 RepID=A0A1C6T3S0_9ACTN|nr:ABC transporter permease [Micromonospora rhizosphaerae]SCL36428.1 peptide/nickel transport system permease protein [Micromonospora rhizosphaerae]
MSTESSQRRALVRERRRRRRRESWHLLRENPLTLFGIGLVLLLVFVALVAPLLTPYDPVKPDLLHRLEAPSTSHPFGTDDAGRDVLARVVYGARISLRIGILAVAVIVAVGVPIGVLAGTVGGRVDAVIMRIADMFLAFPTLVLALAVAATLGGGLQNVVIAVAIAGWPWYARLVRSAVLSVRHQTYISAARVGGSSWLRVTRRHILPNSIAPIIVQASQDLGFVVLLAASLGFLGVGVSIPTPEWGTMINDGRAVFMNGWWVAAFPGLAIVLTVLAFNLAGDGLRDLLDPRSRR